MSAEQTLEPIERRRDSPASYLSKVVLLALVYFALAKLGLQLASINPSATPVWPPTGLALGAVLLFGYRMWPAVFVGAFAANMTTAGSIYTSAAIATGNTLECIVGAYLINAWSDGRRTFDTPAGVGRFALIVVAFSTPISATIGVSSLSLAGYVDGNLFVPVWLTWWLGDLAGAVLFTPLIVLWANPGSIRPTGTDLIENGAILIATCAIGLIAFSPLFEWLPQRPLAFLAILPLLWAALRRDQRDTAAVTVILAAFAVWGASAESGPFARAQLNEAFLLLFAFMVSASVPSLALSADVNFRRRAAHTLQQAHDDLDRRVNERTEALTETNRALRAEIERRELVEKNLTEHSIHLREAQRLANLGSWVWDIRTNKLTWSDQLLAIYGISASEFGGTFEDFIGRVHEDDREPLRRSVMAALNGEDAFQGGERIVRPDGEIRYLQSQAEVVRDERGEPIRMLGICLDVTETKRTETALRKSEGDYQLFIQGVRDYAIYMLDRSGRIVSWNIGAEHISGYSQQEIIGEHFSRFYTEEDRVRGLPARALETAIREGKYEAEGWRVRKDGSRFWANAVIDPIYDEDGALLGFAKITRDITERREAQIALEQAREQLAQAQKLEAIGQLTGGIAHDFNNLLMIVSGQAELLRRRVTDPKQVRSIDAIRSAAERGEALTRQLLGFARRQPLSPTLVDLNARIGSLQEMLRSSLRGDIELIYRLPDDLWQVVVDPGELELALVNISVNARDAMPQGGTITVSARNVRIPSGSNIGLAPGDYVAVSVSDTGHGIPSDVLPKVFEPFFTTKPVGKGTGLGLSQVYGFARQSGGTATAESKPGEGTTITMYLPRSLAAPLAHEEPVSPAVGRGEGTVLVVEDNWEVAAVTRGLLEDLGYRVVHAENAASAFRQLEDNSEAVRFVISDIVMPGEANGISLARSIRERFPKLPILLTTGYSEAARRAESEFILLRKPFQIQTLRQAIERLLHGAQ